MDKLSFWKGSDAEDRRLKYAKEYEARKELLEANAANTIERIERVTTSYEAATGVRITKFASGWRPGKINEATANAASGSPHLDANAGDAETEENGEFAWWCFRNVAVLEQAGLYMEHPGATVLRAYEKAKAEKRKPTPWCHLTPHAPVSHLRVYWPDLKARPEWDEFVARGGYAGITYADWLKLPPKPLPKSQRST